MVPVVIVVSCGHGQRSAVPRAQLPGMAGRTVGGRRCGCGGRGGCSSVVAALDALSSRPGRVGTITADFVPISGHKRSKTSRDGGI